jgi:hypothetical protein
MSLSTVREILSTIVLFVVVGLLITLIWGVYSQFRNSQPSEKTRHRCAACWKEFKCRDLPSSTVLEKGGSIKRDNVASTSVIDPVKPRSFNFYFGAPSQKTTSENAKDDKKTPKLSIVTDVTSVTDVKSVLAGSDKTVTNLPPKITSENPSRSRPDGFPAVILPKNTVNIGIIDIDTGQGKTRITRRRVNLLKHRPSKNPLPKARAPPPAPPAIWKRSKNINALKRKTVHVGSFPVEISEAETKSCCSVNVSVEKPSERFCSYACYRTLLKLSL